MFRVEAAEQPARQRRDRVAPAHPSLMDSIAGPINVAAPDAVEAQEQIAMLFRPRLFQLVGKTQRRFAAQPSDWSPWPFARGPCGVGEEASRMTELVQAAGEAFQVSLGPANLGMTAADESDR